MENFMVFLKEACDHVLQVTPSFEGEHDLAYEDAETGAEVARSWLRWRKGGHRNSYDREEYWKDGKMDLLMC